MRRVPLRFPTIALCLACIALCGCDAGAGYPRDPERTLQRVRGGVMRVGAIHDPPFVVLGQGEPQGREAALVRAHARRLDARIAWHREGAGAMLRALEEHRLDLVVGGHVADSPWAEHVSLSREYAIRDADGRLVRRAVALPPGENAWQLAFERHAAASRALLEGQTP